MITSDAYIELVNRAFNQSRQDGHRAYPAMSFEITLMNVAQQRASQKETALFGQLCSIFDWQLSRRQQNHYRRSLKNGSTLILTDLTRTILWASHNVLSLTGYAATEIVGHTPAMLQGDKTDSRTINHIRHHLKKSTSVKTEVLNYRKNGESYLCHITIDPLWTNQGELTHFLAVEEEIK